MNQYGVRTTKEDQMNFPFDEYPIIDATGVFTVTLMDKTWGKSGYLICAFLTENNIKFRVNVWRKQGNEIYSPKKSEIDFSKIPNNTKWICTFECTKNGNIVWQSAVPADT